MEAPVGEFTRADASRIQHKLDSGRQYRKNGELAFLAVVLCGMAFIAGYVVATVWPYDRTPPAWAEKVGEVRGQRMPTPAPHKRK